MSCFAGDAFSEDHKRDVTVYGCDVVSNDSHLEFSMLSALMPTPHSKGVAQVPADSIHTDVVNHLALGDALIAYAVGPKRNLIRVLHLKSGEKCVLRSHLSPVLDVRFSPLDSQLFGSIDCGGLETGSDGNGDGHPHVFVARRNGPEDVEHTVFASLSVSATRILPHPLMSNLWAISGRHHVAVFSTNAVANGPPVNAFTDLPMNASVDQDTIVSMAFSVDGNFLVAAVQPANGDFCTLKAWRVQEGFPLTPVSFPEVKLPKVVSLTCVAQHILTVSPHSVDETVATFELNSWQWDPPLFTDSSTSICNAPTLVQKLLIDLPVFKGCKVNKSANPFLDMGLTVEPRLGRFAVLHYRRSAFVAVIAVHPQFATAGSMMRSAVTANEYPLFHVTLLDLKTPVVMKDVSMVLGQRLASPHDGSSTVVGAEVVSEDDHMEIACYQESMSPEGASVNLFFLPINSLFDFQAYQRNHALAQETKSKINSGYGGFLGSPASSTSGSFLGLLSMNSLGDGLDNSTGLFSPTSVQSPVSSLLSTTSMSAPTSTAGLSGLRKIDSSSLFGKSAHSPVPVAAPVDAAPVPMVVPAPVAIPVPVAVPTPVTAPVPVESSTTPSANSAQDDLPYFLKTKQVSKNVSILSMLKKATAPPPSSESNPLADVLGIPVPVVAEPIAPVVVAVETPVEIPTVVPTPPLPAPSFVSDSPIMDDKVASDDAISARIAAVPEANDPVTAAAAAANMVRVLRNHESPPGTLMEMLLSMREEIRELKAVSSERSKKDLSAIKEVVNNSQQRTTNAITKISGNGIDANTLKTLLDAMRTSIIQEVTETLTTRSVPLIASKLRESVKDSMKETVKASLGDSFRNAFENSLLPAFQAGTDRLFAQLNDNFELGMKTVALETEAFQSATARSCEELEKEVIALRQQVASMEETIQKLVTAASSNTPTAVPIATPVAPRVLTPRELLAEGNVQDAVKRALNMKEVSVTVDLLQNLTPAILNEKCAVFVRLCVTQQLVSDMTVNTPVEGFAKRMEWIKNLVIPLLNINLVDPNVDPNLSRNFVSILAAIRQGLGEVLALAEKLTMDTGDDNATTMPPSVHTDLSLLIAVVDAKLRL